MRSLHAALPARHGRLAGMLGAAALVVCACAPAVPARSAGPGPSYPALAAGPYVTGADTVSVLPSGATAFPVVRGLLAEARRSVRLEMYELQRDDLTRALLDAHARGVDVLVIIDVTAAGSAASARRLRSAGVDVVDYPVRAKMIDHVKLLVVDSEVAVIGGINWGNASAAHHDFDVEVRGAAVANLDRVITRDLITCGRSATVANAVPDADVIVAATLPADEVRPLVMDGLERASRRLDLELYVLTDLGVVHALERAAARGVAVRVLLDPSQRPSDAAATELRVAGVPVRLHASHGELLHAKAMVVDGRRVVFGSANWSGGGFQRNHEVDLDIRDSPSVASAFLAAMDADWAAASPGT